MHNNNGIQKILFELFFWKFFQYCVTQTPPRTPGPGRRTAWSTPPPPRGSGPGGRPCGQAGSAPRSRRWTRSQSTLKKVKYTKVDVYSIKRFHLVSVSLTTWGLKGGVILFFSKSAQLMLWKNECALTALKSFHNKTLSINIRFLLTLTRHPRDLLPASWEDPWWGVLQAGPWLH